MSLKEMKNSDRKGESQNIEEGVLVVNHITIDPYVC